MSAPITISYEGDRDGGVTIRLSAPQATMSLPLNHDTALTMAATILHNAGVTRTELEGIWAELV